VRRVCAGPGATARAGVRHSGGPDFYFSLTV